MKSAPSASTLSNIFAFRAARVPMRRYTGRFRNSRFQLTTRNAPRLTKAWRKPLWCRG